MSSLPGMDKKERKQKEETFVWNPSTFSSREINLPLG
jgi:hypothetical protein